MRPYYEKAGVRLFLGNCLEVMPGIERADHVIADPPYEAEAHTMRRRVKWGAALDGGGVMKVEAISFAPISEEQRMLAGPEDRTDADLAQYLLGRGLDIESLPTFGGQPPRDTRDVWSWDERHLLVGNGLDIRIVERPDENAE